MKTELFKDKDGKICTFSELREHYMVIHNSDLPIDDGTMQLLIYENLVQNGGDITLIRDDALAWCNDYSEYNEADRYLSQEERDNSVKHIYECIVNHDSNMAEVASCLTDLEGDILLKRLAQLQEVGHD